MKFDDTRVSILSDLDTQIYFGEPPLNAGRSNGWPCAYMLLYESQEVLDEYFGLQVNQPAATNSANRGRPNEGRAGNARDNNSRPNPGKQR